MPSDITIRTATLQDRTSLEAMWLAFMNEQAGLEDAVSVAEDALERWRNDYPAWVERDRRHILVAESSGDLAGFAAALRWSPPPIFAFKREVYIEDFYVSPGHRRQGVGTELYEAMRDWAESWGAERMRLSVLASNERAGPFWESLGLRALSVTMVQTLESEEESVVEETGRRIGFQP